MEKTVHADMKENRQRRLALMERILEISGDQRERLDMDDIEGLQEAAEKWKRVAGMIDTLDAAYKQLRKQALIEDIEQTEEFTAALTVLERKSRSILEKIDRMQRNNSLIAEQKMLKVKTELKNTQRSNERIQSYVNPYSSSASVYFDKKN